MLLALHIANCQYRRFWLVSCMIAQLVTALHCNSHLPLPVALALVNALNHWHWLLAAGSMGRGRASSWVIAGSRKCRAEHRTR